jgi:subtilase family serine protease
MASILVAGYAIALLAQAPSPAAGGRVAVSPRSGVLDVGDIGQRAHTNLQVLVSSADFGEAPQLYGPPFPGTFYQTPASIACIYRLQPAVPGCDPNVAFLNPQGGRRAIAIVDAYDDPNAYADLQFFSGQFGLAAINPTSFVVVFAPHGGSTPGSCVVGAPTPPSAKGTGWDIEESLDIEWAHAMAPTAMLYLVEAQSNSFSDLNCAVSVASNLVSVAGGGEVSMSWGSAEFPLEVSMDAVFTTPNVVYFASSGDRPGVSYPSSSTNVISVGGTSLSFDTSGHFEKENTWQSTGGGASRFEPRPSYQDGIADIVGPHRGTPDIASDANPYTGVWVFDSVTLGRPTWYIVGGTSVSSPMWAAIVNTAGRFAASSQDELTSLYADPQKDFTDITRGDCGPYMGDSAVKGWDFCSGLGSPRAVHEGPRGSSK